MKILMDVTFQILENKNGRLVPLSKKEVSEALGKFHLKAKDDGNGNYILEILEE